MIFDPRRCELGEGPFWHPGRGQLFWFDILHSRLMSRGPAGMEEWAFPEMVSAAGWISHDEMVIAGEGGLFRFDLASGRRVRLAAVQAGHPSTRSNDGRADRQGGFWWGTMGRRGGGDPGRGALWRWHRGETRCLVQGLTIPNSICFTPDGRFAHFSDTATRQVMKVALDAEGWPMAAPEVFLDLRDEGLNPDGAVIDAEGAMWLAQWGAGRVAAYGPDGRFLRAVAVGAPHSSCPAFGGPGLEVLFVTTAQEGMPPEARLACPDAGKVFALQGVARGLPEPRVLA